MQATQLHADFETEIQWKLHHTSRLLGSGSEKWPVFLKNCIFKAVFAVSDTRHHTFYTMSEKRAAEGAPEVAEKKAKHAEDEEENVAEEEDIEEEENEEEGDDEEDVEGVRVTL